MSSQILEVLSSYGIASDQTGKNRYRTHCPFPDHDDDTPSFVIYEDTNSMYCYGCGYGGGPLQFVMKMDRISKQAAREKLGIGDSSKEVEQLLAPKPHRKINFNTEANYVISRLVRTRLFNGRDLQSTLKILQQVDKKLAVTELTEDEAKELIHKVTERLDGITRM